MKRLLYFLVVLGLSFKVNAQQWIPIFDGESLSGWTKVDPPIDIKVEEGIMKLHMTPHTLRHAFIRTNESYKDFILELEFSRDLEMDSGILLRAETAPDSAFSGLFGYQIKIDPRHNRNWTGGIMTDFGNGYQWLHTLENNPEGRKAEKAGGEWNKLRVEVLGQEISVYLNGVPTTHLIDDKYQEGYIAFKFHYLKNDGDQANLELAFRNMKILTNDLMKYKQESPLPTVDTRGIIDIKYFR